MKIEVGMTVKIKKGSFNYMANELGQVEEVKAGGFKVTSAFSYGPHTLFYYPSEITPVDFEG